MKVQGIYQIRNKVTGKVYVGSSVDVRNRLSTHRYSLLRNRHPNRYLQGAWNLWGHDNFSFEVIEVVPADANIVVREQFHMDRVQAHDVRYGYNLTPEANSNRGIKRSAAIRAAYSAAARQRGNCLTPEGLLRSITAAQEGRIKWQTAGGRHSHTAEARQRIAQAHTGRKWPDRQKPSAEQEAVRIAKAIAANQVRDYKVNLQPLQVRCVRALQLAGVSYSRLSQYFAVSKNVLSAIVRGKRRSDKQIDGAVTRYVQRSLTDEQVAEVRALYASGFNYAQVARRTGINERRVWKIVRGAVYKETATSIARRRGNFTLDQVAQIRQLRANGARIVDIAKQFNVKVGTIQNIVRGHNYQTSEERNETIH